MSERTEKFHSEVEQEMLKAKRAQARAAAGPMGLLSDYPLAFAIVFGAIAAVMFVGLVQDRERRASENDAWYRAKLECRLSGGTYEYFGTQGYACIPAPSSSSNRQ